MRKVERRDTDMPWNGHRKEGDGDEDNGYFVITQKSRIILRSYKWSFKIFSAFFLFSKTPSNHSLSS